MKLVEPGYAPTTNFGANAIIPFDQLLPGEYADFAKPIIEGFAARALRRRRSMSLKVCGTPCMMRTVGFGFQPALMPQRSRNTADRSYYAASRD